MCACCVQSPGCTSRLPVSCIYMVCSYVESNSVLVADDDTTSAVSPTRGGAPRKDVCNAESPTKCLRLPSSVNGLSRLPKHNRPRCLRVVNSEIHAPRPLDLAVVFLKPSKITYRPYPRASQAPRTMPPAPSLFSSVNYEPQSDHTPGGSRLIPVIMYLSFSSVIG